MASNKKQNEDAKDVAQTSEEQPQQGGSKFGTILRYALVIVLIGYVMRGYFAPSQQAEDGKLQNFAVHGETMGTTWSAIVCTSAQTLLKINESEELKEVTIESCEGLLAHLIQTELDKVDDAASTYRSNSEVSKFNKSTSTDWFEVSPETAQIVADAQTIAKNTDGAFDVTVAPLVNLYRFGPNKAPLTELPSDEQIEEIRKVVGYEKLDVRTTPTPALKKAVPGLSIDLSGVAKGFAVDLAAQALEAKGLNSYMLEVGGEIRCRGQKTDTETGELKSWVLGIQTPEVVSNTPQEKSRAPQLCRFLSFGASENGAVLATSGDYHNFLQVGDVRFSHIVNPKTGKPTEIVDENAAVEKRLGSVSIASNSCAELSCAQADAYATAFFALGADEGEKLAEKLNVAVLFLFRADDSADLAGLTEISSPAFKALGPQSLEEFENADQNKEKESK